MRSTCDCVFVAYSTAVNSICLNLGSPSYFTSSFAFDLSIADVCGTNASSIASLASDVPATDTRTAPSAEAGGMSLNAGGSWSGRTTVHGPSNEAAVNQRPETSTKILPDATSRTTFDSVFVT